MQIITNSSNTISSELTRRIALVGPNFFSYVQAIRDEFIARGYPCSYFDERHSNSISAKITYRLQLTSLLKRQRDRHLAEMLKRILADGTTDVFLINTEVATPKFVQALRSQGVRVHLYMWDSTRNKNSFLHLLPLLNGRSSFEPGDCEMYGMTYIPLFAERIFSVALSEAVSRKDELVFLGTLHSHRAKLLQALERAVKQSGLSIRKLVYYHSRVLFGIKCFIHPSAFQYFSSVRTQSFDKGEIASAYFRSRGVLDIHHPGQAGLTSRTFESLRSGAWLITLNRTVLSLPEELRARVLLLTDLSELNSHLMKVRCELPPLSPEMDYFLSLERFSDELLAVGGLPPRQSLECDDIPVDDDTRTSKPLHSELLPATI